MESTAIEFTLPDGTTHPICFLKSNLAAAYEALQKVETIQELQNSELWKCL